MNERVRRGGNEGGAAQRFHLWRGQTVLRGWEVCKMGGLTSRLPRLPLQPQITSPGRDTEAREQKPCPEKESEQLGACVLAPVFSAARLLPGSLFISASCRNFRCCKCSN